MFVIGCAMTFNVYYGPLAVGKLYVGTADTGAGEPPRPLPPVDLTDLIREDDLVVAGLVPVVVVQPALPVRASRTVWYGPTVIELLGERGDL